MILTTSTIVYRVNAVTTTMKGVHRAKHRTMRVSLKILRQLLSLEMKKNLCRQFPVPVEPPLPRMHQHMRAEITSSRMLIARSARQEMSTGGMTMLSFQSSRGHSSATLWMPTHCYKSKLTELGKARIHLRPATVVNPPIIRFAKI
jgi:hypothetical protein